MNYPPELSDKFTALLLTAVKASNNLTPPVALPLIRDRLSEQEFKTAEAFLNWCVYNERSFTSESQLRGAYYVFRQFPEGTDEDRVMRTMAILFRDVFQDKADRRRHFYNRLCDLTTCGYGTPMNYHELLGNAIHMLPQIGGVVQGR
jgi:hypothetical protein